MDVKDVFPPPQRLTPRRLDRIRSVLLEEISAASRPGWSRRTSRRGRVWLMCAATVVVTAVAVILTVTIPVGRAGRPRAGHSAVALSAGRQILLAAAVTVAHQTPGKYWHVVIRGASVGIPGSAGSYGNVDQWTARDGTFWTSPPCKQGLAGKVVMRMGGGVYETFGLGSISWTYNLVRHWPATAAGLKARIATYSHNKSDQLSALTALELLVPAPPAIRAAAYRAIATFPGVQNRGPVRGGDALFIPAQDGGPLHLVIDPARGLIHSQNWPEATGQMSWTVLAAQWSNQLPKVIPSNKYYCSSR